MRAEIIAIGTELTSGAKLDTNSQWLSLQLADLGIPVHFHSTVADDLEANVDILRIASRRADLVLITGGLGPTLDDLTRDAMARLADVELELHQPSLDQIEQFFRNRGGAMPERNRVQAMIPVGAEPLANPIGTAPGIWMRLPREVRSAGSSHSLEGPCLLAALPGVPSEMKKMFLEQVRPRLAGGNVVIRRARINCFGIGESHTEELLGELTARGHDPEIGITAHEATITLRMIAQGNSEEECRDKIETASREIRDRLGEYVFGVEDEELEHVVVRELHARGLKLVTMEAGTGGLLAERIAHVEQARSCYLGGMVLMHCSGDLVELGENHRRKTGADYVLIVGSEEIRTDHQGHAVSTIPIGLIGPDVEQIQPLTWSGNPAITRSRAYKAALDLLRRHLRQGEAGHFRA
jgi:nicotinamide-nucleotide amidase